MTFTSVCQTTAAVEDAVEDAGEGAFAQVTEITKRKWLTHHTFSTAAEPSLDVILTNQLH